MTCKIKGCPNPAFGHGLCAKHYFRQRRHGDPAVTHKPGPKSEPIPEPKVKVVKGIDQSEEVAALKKQLVEVERKNAELRDRVTRAEKEVIGKLMIGEIG
jgi:hypothetical protein